MGTAGTKSSYEAWGAKPSLQMLDLKTFNRRVEKLGDTEDETIALIA